jgi:hypothetical protein
MQRARRRRSRSSNAVIGFALLAFATTASGVAIGPAGIGDALIYPYYTVRNAPKSATPFNSLLSVVNRTSQGKAVKVRFREALAGAPVFEANVFLSPKDVWTAAVIPYAAHGAAVIVADRTCTQPTMRAGADGTPSIEAIFESAAFAQDPIGNDPERTREGFVEILEMGTIRAGTQLHQTTIHINTIAQCNLGDDAAIAADLDPPTGGIYGSLTLVNVLEGTAYAHDAVALAQWSNRVHYTPAGSYAPTLGDASPPTSSVIHEGKLLVSSWESGVDAVNAVLSAGSLEAEYMREPGVEGATDIVYTMPTKPLLVSTAGAAAPFVFALADSGACELSKDWRFSREEQFIQTPQGGFPELLPYAGMCWTSTVQSLNVTWPDPTAVVGSRAGLRYFIASHETFPESPPFTSGVATQSLSDRPLQPVGATTITDLLTGVQTIKSTVTYNGLPVVGVSMMRYVNGTLDVGGARVLSTYGAGGAVRTIPDIRVE